MTLRERIEARRAALLSERATAEAAEGLWPLDEMVRRANFLNCAAHIAAQDPAATIARVDRELAGCAADLALLGHCEAVDRSWTSESGKAWCEAVLVNLNARYPEGAS